MDSKERERRRWQKRQDRKLGVHRRKVGGRRPKLTELEEEALVWKYENEATAIKDLARAFNVAPSTVVRYARKHSKYRRLRAWLPIVYAPTISMPWYEVGMERIPNP